MAELNANIEEITHQRAFTRVPVQTVEVKFVLGNRNHEHVDQIVQAPVQRGFPARLHLD